MGPIRVDKPTWTWNGTTWTQQSPASSPPARQGVNMAYAGARAGEALFGGAQSTYYNVQAGTYNWNGTTWNQLSPPVSPSARARSGIAFDTATSNVVLFGGQQADKSHLGDTWTLTINPAPGSCPASGYQFPSRIFGSITRNADNTLTVNRKDQTHYTFSPSGQLLKETDRNGYATTLAYNANSQLATVTDPAGRTLSYSYGANGKVASVTDTAGRQVLFAYNDGAGNLTDVTDVGGGVTHFTYDANHLLLTMTDPRGGMVTNVYDGNARVLTQTDAMNRKTTFSYSTSGTTITDPNGNVTVENYSGLKLTSVTKGSGTPQAATWSFTYDPTTVGLTSVTDPNNHITRYTYDANGNELSVTDPLGRKATFTYDNLNDLVSATDPRGYDPGNNAADYATTLSFDANGNLQSRSRPLKGTSQSQVTSLGYDPSHPGDVVSMTDPAGKAWQFGYDGNGDLASETAPPTPENASGNKTVFCYDAIGRRTEAVKPKGTAGFSCPASPPSSPTPYTSLFTYDNFGDLLTVTDPLSHKTIRQYDAGRNLVKYTDADNNLTQSTFDADSELTQVTRADGTVLKNGYDNDGNRTSQTDGKSNTTNYSFDPLNRVASVADPLNRQTGYTYDGASNRLTKQDPGGNCAASPKVGCTTFGYDAGNQLTAITYSDGTTPNVSGITYDSAGHRTAMSDGSGTSTWSFDSLNRLVSHTNGNSQTVGYGYDLRNQVVSIAYPGGSCSATPATLCVTRSYDAAGRLASVSDPAGHVTSFGFEQDNNSISQAYPNTLQANSGFDGADRLMSLTDTKASTTVGSMSYGRDNANQVSSETDTGLPPPSSPSYGYTPLNQLASVSGASYVYDPADNLIKLTSGTVQSYDAANQLTTSSTISLVGTASGGDAGTSTTVTLNLSGVQANDQILVATTQANGTNVTGPAGYTTVGTFTSAASGGASTIIYRKTAAGGEPNATLTYPLATAKSAIALVYRGVNPTSPIDATSNNGATSATSLMVPSLSASVPGDELVMSLGASGHLLAANWSPPSGMSTEAQKSDQALTAQAGADQLLLAAGPTGSRTATFGTSSNLVGVLLALKPSQTSYGYDSRGDRTTMTPPLGQPAVNYTYDQAERLTGYTTSGINASYAYNGDGLRMSKKVGSTTTQFSWDQSGPLPMLLSDGSANYIYGTNGLPIEQFGTPTPIALVSTVSGGDAGTSGTVTLPLSGVKLNDQILVATTEAQNTTVSGPSGYTTVGTYSTGSGTTNGKTILYRLTATGTETSFSLSYGSLAAKSVVAVVYRGVDPFNPIDSTSFNTTAGGTAVTAPSLNTNQANDQLVALSGSYSNAVSSTWTPPTGMTDRVQINQALTAADAADQLIATAGATGARTSTYGASGQLTAVLVALRTPTGYLYYHHDHLGSTRLLTDDAGNIVGGQTFDSYGRPGGITGAIASPLGFAGQYMDAESGLIYLRARYYDPTTGQFVSADPAARSTRSRYGYTRGNPLNRTDPSGLSPTNPANNSVYCPATGQLYDTSSWTDYQVEVLRSSPDCGFYQEPTANSTPSNAPSYAAPDVSISAPGPSISAICDPLATLFGIYGLPIPFNASSGASFGAGIITGKILVPNVPGLVSAAFGTVLQDILLTTPNPVPGQSPFNGSNYVMPNGVPFPNG